MSIHIGWPQLIVLCMLVTQFALWVHGDLKRERGRTLKLCSRVVTFTLLQALLWWGGWYDPR